MKDKLSAKYVGKGNHANDVGSVRTDNPIPSTFSYFYFEVCRVRLRAVSAHLCAQYTCKHTVCTCAGFGGERWNTRNSYYWPSRQVFSLEQAARDRTKVRAIFDIAHQLTCSAFS
jgi:hypothetical protein